MKEREVKIQETKRRLNSAKSVLSIEEGIFAFQEKLDHQGRPARKGKESRGPLLKKGNVVWSRQFFGSQLRSGKKGGRGEGSFEEAKKKMG